MSQHLAGPTVASRIRSINGSARFPKTGPIPFYLPYLAKFFPNAFLKEKAIFTRMISGYQRRKVSYKGGVFLMGMCGRGVVCRAEPTDSSILLWGDF